MSKRDGINKMKGPLVAPRSLRVALVRWQMTEDSSHVYEKFYAMPGAAHARAGALRERGAFDVRVYESSAGPWTQTGG
jgi:hypothetical protein